MDVGQVIRDYRLEEKLGAGGAGEVWRARHVHIGKQVAIKVIYRSLSQDQRLRERVIREAAAMANLDHPYIVRLHEFFFLNDQPHLVMDCIDGGSLQSRIDSSVRLRVDEALSISEDILSALNYAHTRAIVHRDVKPANILLAKDGHAYITDFGTALMLGKTRTTQYGKTVGTPEYMSPEQIKGDTLDHRTDVYSYGCVLYEMLTGQPPHGSRDKDALTDFAIMTKHLEENPVPLTALNPEVDDNTAAIVEQSLQKDPNLRPAGCAAMAASLRGEKPRPTAPVTELTGTMPEPEPPGSGRSPWWASRWVWVWSILLVGVSAIFFFEWTAELPPQKSEYRTQFEREQSKESRRREVEREEREEEWRRAAELERRKREEFAEQQRQEAEQREREERLAEQRRQAEAQRVAQERRAEQRRREEQERRKQKRIRELAKKSFYRRFGGLAGTDPERTKWAEEWKEHLHCYALVDYEFFARHPDRGDSPIDPKDPRQRSLVEEWLEIRNSVPGCGPYH